MVTIYDVAARAGVSVATVSRYMNGTTVRPALAARVEEAATALGFVPNRVARTLRRRHSEIIALVLPDIGNPFYTSLARGVEDVAQEAGYSVVLCNSDDDPVKEANYLTIALSERMAGVVVAPAGPATSVDELLAHGCAVVAVDRPVTDDIDSVVLDNVPAAREATEALWRAGYRRIACITGPLSIVTAADRRDGWAQVMGQRAPGFPVLEYLRAADYRVGGGRAAAAELLELHSPPDAVLAANNVTGVGALQVLAERGVNLTGFGVAVIGDLPFTTLAPDAIPHVSLPTRQMGVIAARRLLDRIGGSTEPTQHVVLPGELRGA